MSDDLHALLARASHEVEGVVPALDGDRLGLVRSAARRRRIVRRTAESFAGVGVVGVLGVGLWFGLGQQTPEPVVPVVTPTLAPTLTPTPTPPPTPAAPAGPPTRAESIDDATVLERLAQPRTGEVWQTPRPAPEVAPLLLPDGSQDSVFLVGTRAAASIYIAVLPDFYGQGATVNGLYEIDADGPRLIACPSARVGDPCVRQQSVEADGIVRDESTFYDTFTLPRAVDLGDGYIVTTTRTHAAQQFPSVRYGQADALVGGEVGDRRPLRELGALTLAVESFPSEVPGLTSIRYVVVTPFGTSVNLVAADAPGGDFDAIRWDERREPTRRSDDRSLDARSPAEGACLLRTFAEEADHVAADWVQAGTTPDGRPVHVPVDGGNAMSRTVRAWQESISWTPDQDDADGVVEGAGAGYQFPTDEGFLAAHALYAVQAPDDRWLLALRGDAVQAVWECV